MWLWLLATLALLTALTSLFTAVLARFKIQKLKAQLTYLEEFTKENPYLILDRVDVAITDLREGRREVDIREMIHFLQLAYNRSVCEEEIAIRIRNLEVFIDKNNHAALDVLKNKIGYHDCPVV